MTQPLTIFNYAIGQAKSQDSLGELLNDTPLVTELDEVFNCVPYKELLEAILRKRARAFSPLGRLGYSLEVMLKAYLAGFIIGIRSTNDLIRRLQEDVMFALICGYDITKPLPHRRTFNRFVSKLVENQNLVDRCLSQITTKLHNLLPRFGEVVAIDPTPVHSHSNPNRKVVSDPQAGWVYKEGKERKKWEWGFRLHLVTDTTYELPIAKETTIAADGEKKVALPLLRKAKSELPWFSPKAVIGDPAYDKYEIFEGIVKEFDADPIIKMAAKSQEPPPQITGSSDAPCCPGGLPLIYRGWSKAKGLKYQCPEKAGKVNCPLLEKCPLKMIWVRPVYDYRRFGYRVSRDSEQWKELYHKRPATERINSRLKDKRRLDSHCIRGLKKINLHCTLSVLVMNAMALAKVQSGHLDELRISARKIA